MRLYPVISHVIPLRLLQTLNLHRWNCNVFAWSRKITDLNYVRNLSGLGLPLPAGAAARPGLKAWPCSPAPPAGRRIFGGGFAPLGASLRRVAGVSRLYWCNSLRLVAVRSRLEVVWCPTCRPPRRKTPTMGSRGRGRLRWQHNDAWPRASLAHSPLRCERDPAIACANQLFRTSTRYSVSGRGCPRSY